LRTMSERWRKLFLLWGIVTAVFLVRGVLPFLIVWLTTPNLSVLESLHAMLGYDTRARDAMNAQAYLLLLSGGIFLLLLYLHWLFLEKKDPYFVPDKLIKPRHGIWFFSITAVLLVTVLWLARDRPLAMFAAAVGNAVFFLLYGFREMAEQEEHDMAQHRHQDLARFLFLEVLDLSFSIDSIFGAFAFTTNVLLILVGNGIGALVVRELTIRGVDQVAKYRWLKNGAMTSIGFFGIFMILESFGIDIPDWLPTVVTIGAVGLTFWASHRDLKRNTQSP